ncbi:MAG: type I methionyl aminopeptidase [Clostridia bacterium]|jgi:methionyl aminopeptidase|nr:type I methionyl aminopeptidase [Clostridia bacterium]MCI2000624.1 type I methionyl aminopeptidase [Clostridia bacterium]MCI2015303.1 type I methionyl aminopeptidase [Clostridia bacterium]
MAITIKTEEQIEKMRDAGNILKDLDEILRDKIKPGVTTLELDKIADDFVRSRNAVPSFKGYGGYPGSICTSVNEEIVHGIPSKRRLKSGDIISIDMGSIFEGFNGDCARTYGVGEISEEDKKLIEVTKQSFFEGIKYAKAGYHLHDISAAVQKYAESYGFGVVRDYVGHGIGRHMHEDPAIPNYKQKNRGPKLVKGMCLAVEPMITAGTYELKVLKDGWTAVTLDGRNAAHYENTVCITDGEPEILTL